MRTQHLNCQAKPTVITHFPSLASDSFDRNLDLHMFMEDIHLALMPIGGDARKHKNFSIALSGNKEECERAKLLIGEFAQFDRHDLVGMVCDAVGEIAKHLAWEGSAVYEIVPTEGEAPRLCGFTSKNLVRLPGWFLQIIPRGDWKLWGKKWVFVPGNRILQIEMPDALGGRKGYLGVLSKLQRYDGLGPRFWREDLEHGTQPKDFDFLGYVRNSEIYGRKVTRTWGCWEIGLAFGVAAAFNVGRVNDRWIPGVVPPAFLAG